MVERSEYHRIKDPSDHHIPIEAVNFLDWPFLGVTAPFVIPALAGILALQSGSIPPKGGTTNTLYKNSQPQRGNPRSAQANGLGIGVAAKILGPTDRS